MRARRPLTAATLAAATGTLLLPAAPATAASPHHLDRKEYGHLHRGMTVKQVARVADIPGVVGLGGGGYQTRRYRGWRTKDGDRVTVLIVFRTGDGGRWRLDMKSVQP